MVVKYDITYKNKIIKCVDFEGFIDHLEYIKDFVKNNTFNIISDVDVCDDFYGYNNLSNTLDGMNYGFQKSTDYFMDIIEETKSYTDNNNGIQMDYEGFAYDMGAVVNGEPECCLNTRLPMPTPCIKIMVDLSFSWVYSQELIYNRGIAITNLVETLLVNGYIVDLYAVLFNTQSDMSIMYTNKIDTQNLSIANIAFMSSPEYFRKIGFVTIDRIRNKPSERGRGYSEILDFMVNKIKKDKIFFIGGGYSGADSDMLLSVHSSIYDLTEKFNKFCNENKIDIVLKTNPIDNSNIE